MTSQAFPVTPATPIPAGALPYDQHAEIPQRELNRTPDPVDSRTSDALKAALSDEIKTIAAQDITIATLSELSRFANVAQELLMVRDPIAEVRRKKRPKLGAAQYVSQGGVALGVSPSYPTYSTNDDNCEPMTVEAAFNETFGAKLIRELVPALSNLAGAVEKTDKKNPIEKIIEGIASAKKAGLDDVVTRLNKRLEVLLEKQYLAEPEPATQPAIETTAEEVA